ncbi:MAG: N-acetylmuramidase family protein [Thalassovita sp.]
MNFKGKAKRLDDIDLPRIGAQIGVGEDEIHAVLDVETRGGGFDKFGRPKMLFEPHIFYRELDGDKRQKAIDAGVAYKKWGTRKYPKDSYGNLARAMKIDRGAALRSASWGMGQIMGFNHKLAGYSDVVSMVSAFLDDEAAQLQAMVKFIEANGLDDELRNHDWRGFARGYNGPGYAKHGYHLKLARAYAKWSEIPDTPFQIDRTPDEIPAVASFLERLIEALQILFTKPAVKS